ncbi:hypothetical protein BJX63DRAFT_397623, partial [Aspergillus granulosus]
MSHLKISPLWQLLNKNRLLLRIFMLPCLALACGSASFRQILKHIWQPRKTFDPKFNGALSVLLTIIVSRAKKLNLLFYLWLIFMVFVVNDFDVQMSHPQTSQWYRETCFCLALAQISAILFFALRVENSECSRCSQKRFSLADVTGEGRNTRSVYFVSTPAVGSSRLNKRIKRFLDQGNTLLARFYVNYVARYSGKKLDDKTKKRLLSDSTFMARGIQALGFLLSIPMLWQWIRSSSNPILASRKEIHGLLLIILGRNMQGALLWTPWDLVAHHALEVDGVLYELKRASGLNDSIEIQNPPLRLKDAKASGREILSRTHVGGTFFTNDEILKCGDELIQISPNYDPIVYNCQALRFNLFRRIMDDRQPNTNKGLRTDWSYEHPNNIIPMILTFSLFINGFDPFSNCCTLSGMLSCMLGIVHFNHMLKGITYGTSTAYGRRFCLRRTSFMVGGMLLFVRVASTPTLKTGLAGRSTLGTALVVLLHLQYGLSAIAWLFQVGQGYVNRNKKELEVLRLKAIIRILIALIASIMLYVERSRK